MKKLYGILIGLLLLTTLQGQILRYSNYTAPPPPGGDTTNYYSEYKTVYNALSVKPSHDTAHFQSNLVYSLDTMDFAGGASVWSRIDLFYVFAQRVDADALINWKDPGTFDCTKPVAPTFTKYEGYTSNGSSQYLTTGFNAYADSTYGTFSRNSATLAAYIRTNVDGNYAIMGSRSAEGLCRLLPRASEAMVSAINSGDINSTPNTNSSGLILATRTNVSTTSVTNYRNGSALTENDACTRNKLIDADIYILCYNYSNSSGPTYYFPGQVSIAFIMDGVTDAEATAINTVIETYMDAIGKGVE